MPGLAADAPAPPPAAAPAPPSEATPAPPPQARNLPPAAPDGAAATLADAADASRWPDADQVVVFDRTESVVEPSGLAHVTRHRLIKALTAAGARRLARQRYDYDPASQLIEIRTVRVHHADGTVTAVDPGAAVDVTQPMHAIYWGARMQCLAVPDLAPGDALEVVTYRKGFMIAYLGQDGGATAGTRPLPGDDPTGRGATGGAASAQAPATAPTPEDDRYIPPMVGHWYDVQLFTGPHPILEKTVTARLPLAKPLQYRTYHAPIHAEVTTDQEHRTYRFWLTDQPARPREWRAADPRDHQPKLVLATVEDWQAKSRWFWEVNQDQFASTPEIDAVVAEVTAGLDGDQEKVHALNHWAAMNIRYCGLNMGEGEGYVLHPGEMVLRERSGVCKDIASMAITLCRAAGYEVYPAMTMAGSRVERIPADQFNHSVGAWKRPDGTWHLLDPTWIPFSRHDWSRAEGEQHYVIGTPQGEDLMQVRAYAPEENRLTLTVRGEITGTGDVVGELHLTGRGQADTRLRRAIGQGPRSGVLPALRGWLATLAPGAELGELRTGEPTDWQEPMTIRCEFRLPGYAAVGARTCVWRPVALNLALTGYGGAVRLADPPELPAGRETPAMLWWAQTVTVDEKLHLPDDFRATLPRHAWTAGDAGSFAACEIRASGDGDDEVVHHGTLRHDRRQVPVARWDSFRAAVNTWREAGAARLLARREGN
jgi:transglutaminase-like putative cysteine protease